MMKTLVIPMISLVLAACPGPDGPSFGPETDPTPAQRSAISTVEDDLTAMASASTNGASTASAALEFVANADTLVAPAGSTAAAAALSSAVSLHALKAAHAAPDDCTVVTANSIAFHNCVSSGDGLDVTINGTISWSGGHVDIDLKMHGNATPPDDANIELDFSGSIDGSATAIKAALSLVLTANEGAEKATGTMESDVDVKLTQGCVSGGTLTISEAATQRSTTMKGASQVVWTGCRTARIRASK